MSFKETVRELYISFLKTLWLWMLITAIACIAVSIILANDNHEHSSRILETVGIAILIGVVFDVVLKSVEYLNVFRDALNEIVYEDRFLRNRSDIIDVWKRVSRILYESKFPQISDQIENRILNTYFPISVNFYYEDVNQSITIEFHDDEQRYISVIESLDF